MSNPSDSNDEPSTDNPYAPGEAAVEMEEPTGGARRERDDSFRIAPSPPPREPTVGRAIANFRVLLRRGGRALGGAWLAAVLGYALALLVGGASAVYLIEGVGQTTAFLIGIPAGLLGAAVTGLYIVLLSGLNGALRHVGFFGANAVPSAGEAFRFGLRRRWSILLVFVAWGIAYAIPLLLSALLAILMLWPFILLTAPLVVAVAMLGGALFYIVPSTNLGPVDSLKLALRLMKTYAGYVTLSALTMIAAGLAAAGIVMVLESIPLLGILVSAVSNFALNFALMVAYVTIFATIEEAEGGFDGGWTREST